MTLYEFTLICLKENKKDFNDIVWIGCRDFQITKENFITASKNIEPDKPYFISTLPEDLIIAGDNFWLSRPVLYNEDLKSLNDIWIFNQMPIMPKIQKQIKTLSSSELSYEEKKYYYEKFKPDYWKVKLNHLVLKK